MPWPQAAAEIGLRAGLGAALLFHRAGMGVGRQIITRIFYLTYYEKALSSHERRNNNLTLEISSTRVAHKRDHLFYTGSVVPRGNQSTWPPWLWFARCRDLAVDQIRLIAAQPPRPGSTHWPLQLDFYIGVFNKTFVS